MTPIRGRFLGLVFLCSAMGAGSCIIGCICYDQFAFIELRGTLVSPINGDPIEGAAVGGTLETADGRLIRFNAINPVTGAPVLPITGKDGALVILFGVDSFGDCVNVIAPTPPPPPLVIPEIELVELEIVTDGCEHRLTFDVNAENFVDPTAADQELRFANPVVVPSCPESSERR